MKQRNTLFLKLIAVFKLVKAVSLIVLGIGAIRLGHSGDPTDKLSQMVMRLGFNPGGRHVDHLLAMVSKVPPERWIFIRPEAARWAWAAWRSVWPAEWPSSCRRWRPASVRR